MNATSSIVFLVAGSLLLLFRWDQSGSRMGLGMLCLFLGLATVYRFLSERSRTLEVSDEGLVVRSWPCRVLRLGWNAVRSCRVYPAARHMDRPFMETRLHYSRWLIITVPGSCGEAAQILDVLKQHLPESAFWSNGY